MIKKIRNYILLAAVALSAASCLDKLPEDEVPFDNAIRSVSDVNQAVIGIYDAFKSSALYSGNLTLLPDLQADFVYAVNGYTNTYGNIWRWKDILATNTDIEAVYQALYAVTNRCTFMMERVDYVRKNTTVDADIEKLDQYCGEAYFARALAYSELIKLFCKAYESDEEAANELGVILTEHYNGNEEMKRASLKDSYQFVLDDLNRAADLLKLEDHLHQRIHRLCPARTHCPVHEEVGRRHQVLRQSDRKQLLYAGKLYKTGITGRKLLSIYVDQRSLHRRHLESGLHRKLLRWQTGHHLCQLRLPQLPSGLCAGRMGHRLV